MAGNQRRGGPQAYPSELSFQSLRNCLVNLPGALVSVLVEANKVGAFYSWLTKAPQNVIVELVFRSPVKDPKADPKAAQRSVYVGWTGMQSKRKLAPVISRDSFSPRSGAQRDREVAIVEIDSTFAKTLGLTDAQQIGVLLHTDPTVSHTVNIEPLTPADWEILELHANFLELNLIHQIRALPNPSFNWPSGSGHPLTLHLSPTSTANITVSSLTPSPPNTTPFAKISPDAEVIVAPKTRAKSTTSNNNGQARSNDDKSSTASKTRGRRSSYSTRQPIFLRGVDRAASADYFDDKEEIDGDVGLKIWVDWTVLGMQEMRNTTSVLVSVVRPPGLQAPVDPQQQPEELPKYATRVVAQLCPWEDAPGVRHVAVSSILCRVLDAKSVTGETIRIEPAPAQMSRPNPFSLKVHPFLGPTSRQKDGFQFGSKSTADREEAARRIIAYFTRLDGGMLLDGPLTDGMVLPAFKDEGSGAVWPGGLLKFDPATVSDSSKGPRPWIQLGDKKILAKALSEKSTAPRNTTSLEVIGESIRSPTVADQWLVGQPLPETPPFLVGVDELSSQLLSHFKHGSSILLTGGKGSGKTSLVQLLATRASQESFAYTIHFPCSTLVNDETRVSLIKDTLHRIFGLAAWGARHGGSALVILDDLDAICPAETELQVGNDNGRSRQISEIVISLVKHFPYSKSRVVVVATSKSKEELNNALVGGHVVQNIINVAAPDKPKRRDILQEVVNNNSQKQLSNGESKSEGWMDDALSDHSGSDDYEAETRNGLDVDPTIDYLDIAGRADGFMPRDLLLLVARARSESLIRTMESGGAAVLEQQDFEKALKGFTPSSLRNVTLQHSTVTFSSIGGLRETRQMLLETLQYPTLYAPIFAKCPLRLRSGLLLYGYPGCGKTLLASAVAGECGLNFISVKGPEILNKYIGASEKSVRDLFERAQAARPCVLFFDEFDSVAPKRGHDSTGVTDRVVNQLLTQMDGAEGLSGVYVLAATSRPDLIDPALLRPGRLDKSLLCDMPDFEDRLDILQALSKKLSINPDLLSTSPKSLAEVAKRTEGYSGADLQAVVYNAHLEAIHDILGDKGNVKTKGRTPQATKGIPDFTYFKYGASEETAQSAAAKIAERAAISAQLAAHKATQQRARAERLGLTSAQSSQPAARQVEKDKEPTIEWIHLVKSLEQTRPSIGKDERHRLASIYKEFVVGRNGEMPSGQGGTEIGGRSSLM